MCLPCWIYHWNIWIEIRLKDTPLPPWKNIVEILFGKKDKDISPGTNMRMQDILLKYWMRRNVNTSVPPAPPSLLGIPMTGYIALSYYIIILHYPILHNHITLSNVRHFICFPLSSFYILLNLFSENLKLRERSVFLGIWLINLKVCNLRGIVFLSFSIFQNAIPTFGQKVKLGHRICNSNSFPSFELSEMMFSFPSAFLSSITIIISPLRTGS